MLRNVSVCKNPDCLALWQPGFQHCPTCHGDLRPFGTEPQDRSHPRAQLFGSSWFDAVARSTPIVATPTTGVVVSFDPDEADPEVEREPVGAGGRTTRRRPPTREA